MTILDQLCEHARERVRARRACRSLASVRADAEAMGACAFEFEKALLGEDLAFICECKKASPSKGIIAEQFDPLAIATDYAAAGADAISVLTEPRWFLGCDDYLQAIARAVPTPCLRKDFTVDPYMIYEARLLGARAVLLIVSISDEARIRDDIALCDSLGLSALVETHDEHEIEIALRAGARVLGVNNRNLRNFTVDTGNSRRLRSLVPESVAFVSESGVRGVEDVAELRRAGVDALLIGETLMRAPDRRALLAAMREAR